jgi:hypothetical protein
MITGLSVPGLLPTPQGGESGLMLLRCLPGGGLLPVAPNPLKPPLVHAVLSPYWAFVLGESGKNKIRREPHAPVGVSGFGGAEDDRRREP